MKTLFKLISQFVKYCLVGFGGLTIHMLILVGAVEFIGFHYLYAALFASGIAAMFNFTCNKLWTFRREGTKYDYSWSP